MNFRDQVGGINTRLLDVKHIHTDFRYAPVGSEVDGTINGSNDFPFSPRLLGDPIGGSVSD